MHRGDIIRGNLVALARNEAQALALEIENEALARSATLDAMRKAMLEVAREWHAMGWLPAKYRE